MLFVPIIDTNTLPLVYESKTKEIEEDNSELKYREYPRIERSSYIDEEENILVVIKDAYLIFSKYGNYKGKVYFEFAKSPELGRKIRNYSTMKWIYMSNIKSGSKPYFLFYEPATNHFQPATLQLDEGNRFTF